MAIDLPEISTDQLLNMRPSRNDLDPFRPYHFLVEQEFSAYGSLGNVATLFLTNRECPFHCVMCDLWKNTLTSTVPDSAIPTQVLYALQKLEIDPMAPMSVPDIKLYNSGNFFDTRAIPKDQRTELGQIVSRFRTVVVENHPAFCDEQCEEFNNMLDGQLEVAIGLETIHPDILPWLNKQMTTESFREAVERLTCSGIRVRTFILLRPPGLTEAEGIHWAVRSIEFAFDCGVECCSIVPVRSGNGALDQMQETGKFTTTTINAMEEVLERGLELKRGRVFMDLWDVEQFYRCKSCSEQRAARIHQMNTTQTITKPVVCQINCAGRSV